MNTSRVLTFQGTIFLAVSQREAPTQGGLGGLKLGGLDRLKVVSKIL